MSFEGLRTGGDQFEIFHDHAEYVIETSRGYEQRPDISMKAQQIHGRSYVNFGYFKEGALDEDGRLLPDFDGTREKEGIDTIVTYLLAVPKLGEISDAESTVRLIEIGENGTVDDLPTYKYHNGDFPLDVDTRIHNIINMYGKASVREVAALGTLGRRESSYELMRAIIQNAIRKEAAYGDREILIASLTNFSLRPVLEFCGSHAAELIGDPVKIFEDEAEAKDNLNVSPVLIEPCKVIDGIIDDIEASSDPEKAARLNQKLAFLTDGLMPEELTHRANIFLERTLVA